MKLTSHAAQRLAAAAIMCTAIRVGLVRLSAARAPGGYGVIAIVMGPFPTLIALPVSLVAVTIGVTVSGPLTA
jgi:hypothetical protein